MSNCKNSIKPFIDYEKYRQEAHWRGLVELHVYQKKAKCSVLGIKWNGKRGKKSNLRLHHGNYNHLYHERINKDVYVVSTIAHRLIHFYLFYFWKVPLKPELLERRRKIFTFLNCVQKGDIIGVYRIITT